MPVRRSAPPPGAGRQRRNTVRVFNALRAVLIIAGIVFTALALVGTMAPDWSLSDADRDTSQGQRLRAVTALLQRADATAATAVLDPSQGASELVAFQSDLDDASAHLIEAAAAYPKDASRFAAVDRSVSSYRRSVERAWTSQAATPGRGTKAYIQASETLQSTALADIAEVQSATDARTIGSLGNRAGDFAVVTGWVAIGLLVVAMVVVARRSHRIVNLGLVLAALLLLGAVSLMGNQNNLVASNVKKVQEVALPQARAAGDARAAAFAARTAEARRILDPAEAASYDTQWAAADAVVSGALKELGTAGVQAEALWTSVRTVHQSVVKAPDAAKAAAIAKGTTTTGTVGATAAFDTEITLVAGGTATDVANTLAAARAPLVTQAVVATLAAILSAGLAYWGIGKRLEEYR